uniref:Uncharacterized protein n=1 Tax=Arundo donax TaxID=35708 RepID=A0A0A8Z5N4_ARUDO
MNFISLVLLTPPPSRYHGTQLITKAFRQVKTRLGIGRNSLGYRLD